MTNITRSKDYLQTLDSIKQKVKTAQIKAHLAVNKEMLILYWQIGKIIVEQRKSQKWGSKVIEQLAQDLRIEFNTIKGLSTTNLKYMATFAETYPQLLIEQDTTISQQTADQLQNKYFISDQLSIILSIPWFHNVEIFTKLKDQSQRIWYASQTIENSWSRNVLTHQIKSNLYSRQASDKKTNNFKITLPEPQSDLANDLIKDEYNFDFITNKDLKERELEGSLIDNIIKFLLELGKGFAFVGKQYNLNVGGDDFYIDLLFYNIKLKSYFVIELKTGKFKPEYVGKMAFYLSVIDSEIKDQSDKDSIGMILCTDKNQIVAEKSVKYITKPVGISEYRIADKIEDKKVKELLPTAKEIKQGIKLKS